MVEIDVKQANTYALTIKVAVSDEGRYSVKVRINPGVGVERNISLDNDNKNGEYYSYKFNMVEGVQTLRLKDGNNLDIFPNSASKEFQFTAPENVKMSVFDLNGKLIQIENVVEGLNNISVALLQLGVYSEIHI